MNTIYYSKLFINVHNNLWYKNLPVYKYNKIVILSLYYKPTIIIYKCLDSKYYLGNH